MFLIVCYPNEALTFKLNPVCLEFTLKYLGQIVNLTSDKISIIGQDLMRLRKNLNNFLSKEPLISASLLELRKELSFSLTIQKQIKEEFLQKDKKTADITKNENPESENKQNAKSITMYSKEMSRNELAKKLGISFLQLQSAKDEIGQIWTSEKLDFNKAKEICSKFDCEIIDKSPKDNF